jgi:UDPglucose 6-dehydrogenase
VRATDVKQEESSIVKISVIGCGYLGTVHAAALAELGHDVIGIDVDPSRIRTLSSGQAPFFEPGLQDILASGIATGRLKFSSNLSDARGARVHFLAVGTPQKQESNAADLTFVNDAIDALIPFLAAGDLVAGKSTVPVGTAAQLSERITAAGTGALLAWNPEFLREGFAVQDTISPDRLVYGVPSGKDGLAAKQLLDEVYEIALLKGTPLVVTDYATAELVKVSANAFLATKISFINAIAEIAEATGADVTQLADAIGFDARIGRRYLNAGIGFGGGCLPKDIRAFRARAEELGVGDSISFLKNIDEINLRRRQRVVDLTVKHLGGVSGKRIAVLGLAFKPESDDVRDSPALDVAVQLNGLGAVVVATDPQAISNASKKHPQLDFVVTTDEAVRDAEAVLMLTEWKEYRELDPDILGTKVARRYVVDGRNVLDSAAWRRAGWTYSGLGKP